MSAAELQLLRDQLAAKERELELVMAIDHIRDTAADPMTMLNSIIKVLADKLAIKACLLALIDRETGQLELKAFNHRQGQSDIFNRLVANNLAEQTAQLDDVTIWQGQDVLGSDAPPGLEVAAVPIILGNHERLGALLLTRNTIPFSQADIQLLQTAEDQIDSAVMQGYAHYELEQHLKELETIYRIDHIRDRQLTFDEMLNTVLQELCNTIAAEMGFVMLYDMSGQQLEMRATTHDDLLRTAQSYNIINQIANESLHQGELVCHNGLEQTLQSIMCLPLILNGQIIGVLGVSNASQKQFRQEDRRLLSAIGSQMDTAIFESLEQRQLRQVLGRSVDPHILERLLASSDVNFLKGERAIITVLYADIRGSTSLAERTEPDMLVGFINHYLGQMTDIILAHEGTLDKFVGDEVMALFGAPFPQADHALRSIRTALAMQTAHQTVVDIWQSRNVDAAPIGIGIATGELIVGEMGSPQRTQYTVIGQAANLGARICSSAQAGQVLISQATYDLAKDHIEAHPIHGMEYKGISGAVTVYEVERVLD